MSSLWQMLIPRRGPTYLLLSCTAMGLSLRASLSCDCTHLMPLLRICLFPPTWVFGNLPFFFIITVMESNAMLIAIINSVNSKVLNISIIFVLTILYHKDIDYWYKKKTKRTVSSVIKYFLQNKREY